jgi:hypothetical protein
MFNKILTAPEVPKLTINEKSYLLRRCDMFQIETPEVLNESKILDVFINPADSSQNFRFCEFTR